MTIYLPNPDQNTPPVLYRWMQAVTNALRNATASTAPDLSGYLPNTTTVQGIGALGFSGTLADGTVLISLRPLDDSGIGALLKITRDAYGRVAGTEAATAADLPYDNTSSGLAATDAQAAIDEIAGGGVITRTRVTLTVDDVAGAGGDFLYFLNGANLALPTAVGNTGLYNIKNVGGASQTVTPDGTETIDGTAGALTLAALDAVTLVSDGANWEIV